MADVWAQTRESEADGWIDRPIGANPEFYTGVTFDCVSESDYESENYENPISWLSCKRKADDLPSWLLTAEPNTGEARTAYVVCLFPEDCGYTYTEPIAVKIVQKSSTDLAEITVGAAGVGDAFEFDANSADDIIGISWWALSIDGKVAEPSAGDPEVLKIYEAAQFVITDKETDGGNVIDWCKVHYRRGVDGVADHITDTWWDLYDIQPNTTGAPRVAYIHWTLPQLEGYTHSIPEKVVKLTQRQ